MGRETCPFCGSHPYEYVDIGVGSVPVAVTCCELGDAYFPGQREAPKDVTICYETFVKMGRTFSAMRDLGMNFDIMPD